MPECDVLLFNARIASMCKGTNAYGINDEDALAVTDGCISWMGRYPASDRPKAAQSVDMAGRWLSPALIDCHTHLIFGGERGNEFEQRLLGESYQQIALSGGGIRASVQATRNADLSSLTKGAQTRVNALMQDGVATIEIKSGYGLDHGTEQAMLEAARTLNENCSASIVNTYLGGHAVPIEFENDADSYIDKVVAEILPDLKAKGLVDAVDAFCETIAFSTRQVARLFECSVSLGIPVKLHADQLCDGGGAELAAQYSALSADHLEYTSNTGVKALAAADSVAVLLPGAFITLGETRLPPMDAFRKHQVDIAVATDCNPGSSPLCSVRVAMGLAARLFAMTPEECLAGATRNAAKALGLAHDRGTLQVGKRADIAAWNINHPRDLCYWMGLNQLEELYIEGQPALSSTRQ